MICRYVDTLLIEFSSHSVSIVRKMETSNIFEIEMGHER